MVAGTGPIMPERAWLCDGPPYLKLKQNITQLICVDDDHVQPLGHLKVEQGQIIHLNQIQKIESAKLSFIPSDLRTVLGELNLTYQAITFCRIPDLPEQLSNGIFDLIIKRLQPGGLAVLSGSGDYGGINLVELMNEKKRELHGKVSIQAREENYYGGLFDVANGGRYSVLIRKLVVK